MNWQKIKAHIRGSIKSWTIWFNGLCATVLAAFPTVQSSFPQLQSYLPPDVYQKAMGILIVGNILLRVKTNKGLDQK